MKPGERRKEKVRWHSVPPAASLYRSVSTPGSVYGYESVDTERREERVVVKAYGCVPPPQYLYPGILPVQSQGVPISSPGVAERDGGVSARKRPGRKARRADSHGSSPDTYGSGFPSFFQNGLSLVPLLSLRCGQLFTL